MLTISLNTLGGVMFGKSTELERELIELIEASIAEREAALCQSWNPEKTIALPWGVKEEVNADNAKQVTEYIDTTKQKKMQLPSGNTVEIITGSVKERKGQYTLILRYQIVERPKKTVTL